MARVTLRRGAITALETDATVHAANSALWMGAGVVGASTRAAGQEIASEALGQGPVPVGEAFVTGAGRLKARLVIRVAVMSTDLVTDADKIRSATRSSLLCAGELGLTSIASPGSGTGVRGSFILQSG